MTPRRDTKLAVGAAVRTHKKCLNSVVLHQLATNHILVRKMLNPTLKTTSTLAERDIHSFDTPFMFSLRNTRQNMSAYQVDTRTSHQGGDPAAYPGVGQSGSTFLSDGSCVMRCRE